MKKLISFITVIIVLFAVCALNAFAFDANDYDYSGGGDSWGGGGSNDGGGFFGNLFGGGDSNSGNSGNYYASSDSGGEFNITTIIVIIIALAVAGGGYAAKNRKGGGNFNNIPRPPMQNQQQRPVQQQPKLPELPNRTVEIEKILKQHDPNFSSNDFLSFAKNTYIDIQTAWCNRDMTPVRPVMHDNLYGSTITQLQSKINKGIIYHYESMVVNTTYLSGYVRDSQYEYITIYLNSRMIDWQEDEKTGQILRGDKTTRWEMKYTMKFMRSIGVVTKEASGPASYKCPNCGAPLEISTSGICEYCSNVVTTGKYCWVLSDFGTVRSDTVDEGIRNN